MTKRLSGSTVSRRQTLSLLGMAAGYGLLSATKVSNAGGVTSAAPAAQQVSFPARAIIRTILKDMSPGDLGTGAVLFHEHLSMDLSVPPSGHYTDDVEMMVEEARAARKDGLSCIVDGGHPDMRRSLAALKRIATESGLPVVASGGYYLQRFYPPDLAAKTSEQIADQLVRDAKADRLGAFGEIGQSNEMTADERKVFLAVAQAHRRTGLPIFTHNAYAAKTDPPVPKDAALRQLDLLEGAGVNLSHLAIGHVCCLDDPLADVAREVARRGAYVGFDRVTLEFLPDTKRVVMILALLEAGYANKLLLSSDFARETSLKKRGGAGLAQAVTVFGPMLRKAGVSEETLRTILVDNPRRFLAFVPVV